MKLIKNKKGYTVVETLIVLAVTGSLFVTTALLIQGQVEKNRYQASMRQVQQAVQQAMRDTENGYFPNAGGASPDTVLVGKRIYFCTVASTNDDRNARQPCTSRPNTIRIENIYWNETTATNPSPDTDNNASPTFDTDVELGTGNETYLTYPGDIRMTKFYKLSSPLPGWNSSSAGFAVMFNNVNPLSATMQAVNLKAPYLDNNNASSTEDDWTGEYMTNGMKVCFEGSNNGSLVIGRGGAITVEMNLDDPACD